MRDVEETTSCSARSRPTDASLAGRATLTLQIWEGLPTIHPEPSIHVSHTMLGQL